MAGKANQFLQELTALLLGSLCRERKKKMAASKSIFHVRSNSLPSKSHPVIDECNEHLIRLGDSHATSSSTSLAHKLIGLEDLHLCVEKLLQLPLTQQAFCQGRQEKWVDELVDGSLRL